MTDKEILEGNMLIAEFMGLRGNWLVDVRKLTYSVSWDQLMPVIEKISTEYDFDFSSVGLWVCQIKRKDNFDENPIGDMGGHHPIILNVWIAVVQFIKWFNSQSKKHRDNKFK